MSATLSTIHVYPIKSCAALSPASAQVEARGFVGDRRWMIADADGNFFTAREHPRLTLIHAQPQGDGLRLRAPMMPGIDVRPPDPSAPRIEATVWDSRVSALAAAAAADRWISDYLGVPARLVFMDAACARPIDEKHARPGDEVSFADGYPLLVISQAALDVLNEKLMEPVPMLRFRPSIVVTGTAAHAEDGWKRIRVGKVEFDVVKPCLRCVLTTVDFERGQFDPSGEPLRTLIGYRRGPAGVSFGQNLIPRGSGTLHIGDAVDVLESAP